MIFNAPILSTVGVLGKTISPGNGVFPAGAQAYLRKSMGKRGLW